MWLRGLREQLRPAAERGPSAAPEALGPAPQHPLTRSATSTPGPACPRPPRDHVPGPSATLSPESAQGPRAGCRATPPRPGTQGGRGRGGSRPGRGRAYLQALGEGAEEHQVRQAPQPPHGGRGPCAGPARLRSASSSFKAMRTASQEGSGVSRSSMVWLSISRFLHSVNPRAS